MIPDLPPDIRFRQMHTGGEDLELAYAIKHAALGPHVATRWGWDDNAQRELHRRQFEARPCYEISRDNEQLGMVSLSMASNPWEFNDFYLWPCFHRSGAGSAILRHCLALADGAEAKVALRYLQWNPVGSLYRRHGFEEVGRTEHHFLMERPARFQSSR